MAVQTVSFGASQLAASRAVAGCSLASSDSPERTDECSHLPDFVVGHFPSFWHFGTGQSIVDRFKEGGIIGAARKHGLGEIGSFASVALGAVAGSAMAEEEL